MKEMVFTFEEDGKFEVEANGYSGKACEHATEPFESVLGVVKKRTATRDALRREQKSVKTRLR